MGKRTQQTFLQRRHKNDQQMHSMVINTTNCCGRTNQNHDVVSPVRMSVLKERFKKMKRKEKIEIKEREVLAGMWR